MSEPSTAADEAERQAADATYPARMEYRMFGDSDGTVDGEVWMVVQAWYSAAICARCSPPQRSRP